MLKEEFIIRVYCLVEEFYQEVTKGEKLRKRGSKPFLRDEEILTMLIVGEYFGLGNDKKIWGYFQQHWKEWFPRLGCRTSFVRQGANLLGILDKIQCVLAEKLSKDKDLFLFDGFPIPLCHVKRHKKSSPFAGQGAIGY